MNKCVRAGGGAQYIPKTVNPIISGANDPRELDGMALLKDSTNWCYFGGCSARLIPPMGY